MTSAILKIPEDYETPPTPRPEADYKLDFSLTTETFSQVLGTLPNTVWSSSRVIGKDIEHNGTRTFTERVTTQVGEIRYKEKDEERLAVLTRATRTTRTSIKMPRFFRYLPILAPPIFRSRSDTTYKLELFSIDAMGAEAGDNKVPVLENNQNVISLADAMPAANQQEAISAMQNTLTTILGSAEFHKLRADRIETFLGGVSVPRI